VPSHRDVAAGWAIAASVSEEVDYDNTMPFWNERNDLGPEMRRSRKPVKEDDRLTGTARSGSVVVEPSTVYVDKLTPHGVRRSA
jgi:hypothetical protein